MSSFSVFGKQKEHGTSQVKPVFFCGLVSLSFSYYIWKLNADTIQYPPPPPPPPAPPAPPGPPGPPPAPPSLAIARQSLNHQAITRQ